MKIVKHRFDIAPTLAGMTLEHWFNTGFLQVLENPESHVILYFNFLDLKVHEVQVWVMESHRKAIY